MRSDQEDSLQHHGDKDDPPGTSCSDFKDPYVYDSDQEPTPMNHKNDNITWRQDPHDSLTDWTIEIVYNKAREHGELVTETTDVYFVHKVHLAAGPRKSEYFSRLFRDGGRFSESKTNTSRIELHELAARAFPQLLDYLYLPESPLEISTDTATALYHLGGYLDIRRLRWEAKKFWMWELGSADRCHECCGTYYEHAKLLNEEKLMDASKAMCYKHIMNFTTSSRLLHVSDPDFWTELVKKKQVQRDGDEYSLHLSLLLGEYFSNCPPSKELFQQLTPYLSKIHRDAAIRLMEAERLCTTDNYCLEEEGLTDLQIRCIEAIAENWVSIDELSKEEVVMLQRQQPLVLITILQESTKVAKSVVKSFKQLHLWPTNALKHHKAPPNAPHPLVDGGNIGESGFQLYHEGYPVFAYRPDEE